MVIGAKLDFRIARDPVYLLSLPFVNMNAYSSYPMLVLVVYTGYWGALTSSWKFRSRGSSDFKEHA